MQTSPYAGIDLHRRRSVIDDQGTTLGWSRVANSDVAELVRQIDLVS
jgi:hypothetical protein